MKCVETLGAETVTDPGCHASDRPHSSMARHPQQSCSPRHNGSIHLVIVLRCCCCDLHLGHIGTGVVLEESQSKAHLEAVHDLNNVRYDSGLVRTHTGFSCWVLG